MLPASMDEDLEGGAKEVMKKMEGKQVCTLGSTTSTRVFYLEQ